MSLKDAMKKVGLKSSKSENEREQKVTTKVEKHQERRNFCEVCETTQPDVERFKHNNTRIDGEWICSNCADKNEILDDFRMTAQSEFSKSKKYRRYYGHTVDLMTKQESVQKDTRKPPSKFRPKNNQNRNRNRNASSGQGQSGKNRPDNRRRGAHNNNNNKPKAKYTIDENGEKNFNC